MIDDTIKYINTKTGKKKIDYSAIVNIPEFDYELLADAITRASGKGLHYKRNVDGTADVVFYDGPSDVVYIPELYDGLYVNSCSFSSEMFLVNKIVAPSIKMLRIEGTQIRNIENIDAPKLEEISLDFDLNFDSISSNMPKIKYINMNNNAFGNNVAFKNSIDITMKKVEVDKLYLYGKDNKIDTYHDGYINKLELGPNVESLYLRYITVDNIVLHANVKFDIAQTSFKIITYTDTYKLSTQSLSLGTLYTKMPARLLMSSVIKNHSIVLSSDISGCNGERIANDMASGNYKIFLEGELPNLNFEFADIYRVGEWYYNEDGIPQPNN